MSITVQIDVSQYKDRLEFAAREIVLGLRSSVEKAARAARRDALVMDAKDAGIDLAYAKKNMPTVKGSTQNSISATWSIPKSYINVMKTQGASIAKGVGLEASTFRLTGGKSAELHAERAFTLPIRNADGSLAFLRFRHGPGTHRGAGLRSISGEMVRSGMGEADGAPRELWERVASKQLAALATAAVQAALDGVKPSDDHGND